MTHEHKNDGVDIHDDGLQDGCARCAEHAERPMSELDDKMLSELLQLTLDSRFGYVNTEPDERMTPRSNAEARAAAQVMTALEHVGKLYRVQPTLVNLYLIDRWRR